MRGLVRGLALPELGHLSGYVCDFVEFDADIEGGPIAVVTSQYPGARYPTGHRVKRSHGHWGCTYGAIEAVSYAPVPVSGHERSRHGVNGHGCQGYCRTVFLPTCSRHSSPCCSASQINSLDSTSRESLQLYIFDT